MSKIDLSLLDDSEKGYIIGLFLGDGSFNKGLKTPRYVVRFALDAKRDHDIAARLGYIFHKAQKTTSAFARENTLIVKVCSKELVGYIGSFVYYRAEDNRRREKEFHFDKHWHADFQYGILAGFIDSDGHVHEHFGAEIKTVSLQIHKAVQALLDNLGIIAETKHRKATKESYSQKPFHLIYLPSREMRKHGGQIPSVKLARLGAFPTPKD